MVVKVQGELTSATPESAWRIWSGPAVLAAVFVLLNLSAWDNGGWGLPVPAVALLETAGMIVVALPFLRLVREADIWANGIEARMFRGTTRFMYWDEIDSVQVHRHAFIPSRVLIENVFGRRLFLKGTLFELEPVLLAVRKGIAESPSR